MTGTAFSATTIPFTINMSESVNVTGTPRIAVDVGGVTRYATYASGTGTSALTFNYAMTAGDLDLDGVTLTSPIDLNGGTLKDLNGNNAALTFTVPNTSNVKVNYPSLGMDFTNGTSGRYTLNGTAYTTLPSFLTATGGTFTRNSIGTYFDSTGTLQTATANTPRFDYDPVTHAAKGILIEESKTNLRTYSSEIDNTSIWAIAGIGFIANNFIAPDGTMTAEKMTPSSGLGVHRIRETTGATVTAGSSYTASVFVRSNGQQYIDLYLGYTNFPNGNGATFDLVNGTITYTFTSTTPTIQNVGNGWYRCSITVAASSTGNTNSSFFIVHSTNSGTANINTTANGTDSYYIWGAQLEQGSVTTSYIPTTTVAVTRNTDSLTVPTGSWYNQNAGSFMNEVSWLSSSGTGYPMFFRVDDTTSNNRWNALYDQAQNRLSVDGFTAGASQGGFVSSSSGISGTAKISSAQALNNTNSTFNGTLGTLDTSWTPPTVSRFSLIGGSGTVKWFRNAKYYPARVTDTQLQVLTQ